jgi:hypothetical protein
MSKKKQDHDLDDEMNDELMDDEMTDESTNPVEEPTEESVDNTDLPIELSDDESHIDDVIEIDEDESKN